MKTQKDKKKDKSDKDKKCPHKPTCDLYSYKEGREIITKCRNCNKIINID